MPDMGRYTSHSMRSLDETHLQRAFEALGALLERRSQRFDLAVIGGSGLLLLEVVRRTTKDVDIIGAVAGDRVVRLTELPPELAAAAQAVGAQLDLPDGWLNPGPSALVDFGLPEGFLGRCHPLRFGGLALHVASRYDQIHFKVYATVDQGPRSKHASDLAALAPTRSELLAAARWCRTHDPSEGFGAMLVSFLRHHGVEVTLEELA